MHKWFIVFVDPDERIGNCVSEKRPFDWLIEMAEKSGGAKWRIVNFWKVDEEHAEALSGNVPTHGTN